MNPKLYKHLAIEHRKTCRALLYALTLKNNDAWMDLKDIISMRLNDHEKACLAFSVLRSVGVELRQDIIEAVLNVNKGVGAPFHWENATEDAAWWAARASQEEKEAYLMAAFEALPKNSKNQLKAYFTG